MTARTPTPIVIAPVCAIIQVSANVVMGRSHLGVHWRMDGVYGALMGETSAIRRLQQVRYKHGVIATLTNSAVDHGSYNTLVGEDS